MSHQSNLPMSNRVGMLDQHKKIDHLSDEGDSEDEYEESASMLNGSVDDLQVPQQASVILPDGRRVRRSITMTSLASQYRVGVDPDVETGSIEHTRNRSSLQKILGYLTIPFTYPIKVLIAPGNHGLVKCVVAYFIASLAVFIPHISDFIGHGDGKHFVATCTVYFYPSRSMGAMMLATIYALVALTWAVIVSTSSMATAIGFNSIDQRALGHAVVLIVWVCGGVGFIGYWKQRLSDPTVGVAASMASMVIFFNITREGSLQLGQFNLRKVLQYFFIVLLGLTISNVVNYLLWPVSARRNLEADMSKTTTQFSQFLSLVTRRFLLQRKSASLEKAFAAAVKSNQEVFASLQKNLKESKLEYRLMGREAEYTLMAKAIRSMEKLAQHLSGLKSSCDAQVGLLPEYQDSSSANELNDLACVLDRDQVSTASIEAVKDVRSDAFVRTFIYHLGPPMKSLAFTTKQALKEMPYDTDGRINLHAQLFVNLDKALALYEEARAAALSEMYRNKIFQTIRGADQMVDREEIAASMDYFSVSLKEFVCETQELMYALKNLELHQVSDFRRTWHFLKFWSRKPSSHEHVSSNPPRRKHRKVSFHLPSMDSVIEQIKYKLWTILRSFKHTEIRFAIKVGVGAALFAMPAMIDAIRPVFVEWRLEWGLLSFFIILNASIGGTYSAALWRVLGSALGTGLAMINWTLFPGNPYALAPLGAIIAAPCMYMIINPAKANAQFGRFTLLSYNLTALYAYSISNGVLDDDDDEGGLRPIITLIALHRMVSVTAGCLWGALINTYVWPIKARVELRQGLSKLWLKIGWSWRQDPFCVNDGEAFTKQSLRKPEAVLDDSLSAQSTMATLRTLLAQSPMEPRLRGKFPSETYTKLLKHTQDILDSTYALSTSLQQPREFHGPEMALLEHTRRQRRELGDLIFLYFYLLASALQICLPLPRRFPSVTAARDRLLAQISHFRQGATAVGAQEEDFTASFNYTLMTGQVSDGLDGLAEAVTELFGKVEAFDTEGDMEARD